MVVSTGLAVDAIPVLADNYVWAISHDGDAIIVDPGESEPVAAWLHDRGLTLRTILITHHHPDHVNGIGGLLAIWPQADVIGPDDARIQGRHRTVGDGSVLELQRPDVRLDVIAVPGHTRSHVAYVGAGMLFSGDTLFSAGCGRLFEGTPTQMLASLDRLAALPDQTLVCCGHEYTASNCDFAIVIEPGNQQLRHHIEWVNEQRAAGKPSLPSTIGIERAINPFLRVDHPDVRDWLRSARDQFASASRQDAFAALRAAKDQFRG